MVPHNKGMRLLVSRRVLLRHAYATIIIGPKTGWNLASTTMSLAASQHRHHGARKCIVKATRVESEPQVEHPPSDLSAGKDDVWPRLSSGLVVTHPAVYLEHVMSADSFAPGQGAVAHPASFLLSLSMRMPSAEYPLCQ